MRMRRKQNLDLRIAKCAHLLAVPSESAQDSRPDSQSGAQPDSQPGAQPDSLRGRWLEVFGHSELRLELGCGKGRFTVESAKAEPDVLFVAIEKTANVMVTALERAAGEGLQNVRFSSTYINDLTRYFAPGELSRIYLNFPDPWPTNRYAKRRLTSKSYLEQYAEVLRPGGEVYLKTDNLPLFGFSLESFTSCGFELLEVSEDIHKNGPVGLLTDYELKFHGAGLPIYQCRARCASLS